MILKPLVIVCTTLSSVTEYYYQLCGYYNRDLLILGFLDQEIKYFVMHNFRFKFYIASAMLLQSIILDGIIVTKIYKEL